METVVELIAAHKRYGTVEALRGVDLAIRQGEVVAILGPNGAGKTTAISLMLGLRHPTAGQVRLYGMDPSDRRARSRCGVMLQESGVPDVLKLREIVDVFRAYYPHPLPTDRALGLAGLDDQADRQIAKLSGGQRQRLYYALAVCGDPDIIFLDEPTVGMDVEARRAFLGSIREFFQEGKTIVLTTHYLEEADQLAGRVVVIDRGVTIADAPPAQIKARVAGKRVSFTARPPLQASDFDGLTLSHLEIDGARVRLLSNAPEAVLGAIFRRGIAVADLEVVGADLEEAFLALTARDGGAAVPAGR
ncbi:MAG TPA: ABC transporter ATP-binding protein [Candidatus Limnocylindrales bacterium]|nr:ABC transporter ATP-binding protein [Candidatus Limnocylindrales bacterium]